MTQIYTQHDAAFNRVASYAVLKDGEPVAKIAFKFPADGAGRLYAYIHWLGMPMVRGFAGGYGYDKRTAACADAMCKSVNLRDNGGETEEFWHALERDTGSRWDTQLRDAGFTVFQTI